MYKSAIRVLWLILSYCLAVLPSVCPAQIVANRQQILTRARQSYYNLGREGASSFQCSITPNWEILFKDQLKDDAGSSTATGADPKAADAAEERRKSIRAAIETLSQLHFTVNVASDNSVTLTHNDLLDQSQEMMDALKKIYGGMEQMTTGFFDTWKLFMLSSPFPEVSSEYQLQARGPQYLLTYREDTSDVVTTMSRGLAISNMKITKAETDSTIQPSFTRTPKGFVLAGYQASYQSQNPEEATQLKVLIDYQTVSGFQMLSKLNLSGTYGGSPFAVELAFSDCKVTKKQ